jgi:hypothetical protein
MSIRAKVTGGICGFTTVIVASSKDGMTVQLDIQSDCPKICKYAQDLTEVNAMDEILRKPMVETQPALLARDHGLHTACLVPIGVLKAVEAAASLALPGSCAIEMERID